MSTFTPAEVVEAARKTGERKLMLHSQPLRFMLLTVLAGAYIAFGGTLSVILGYGFPEITASNPGMQKLISGAAFPVGLILVVVLGAELFTGNNALLVPHWMRGGCSWRCCKLDSCMDRQLCRCSGICSAFCVGSGAYGF